MNRQDSAALTLISALVCLSVLPYANWWVLGEGKTLENLENRFFSEISVTRKASAFVFVVESQQATLHFAVFFRQCKSFRFPLFPTLFGHAQLYSCCARVAAAELNRRFEKAAVYWYSLGWLITAVKRIRACFSGKGPKSCALFGWVEDAEATMPTTMILGRCSPVYHPLKPFFLQNKSKSVAKEVWPQHTQGMRPRWNGCSTTSSQTCLCVCTFALTETVFFFHQVFQLLCVKAFSGEGCWQKICFFAIFTMCIDLLYNGSYPFFFHAVIQL